MDIETMMSSATSSIDLLAKVQEVIVRKMVKFVFLEYCDLHGLQRGRVVPAAIFLEKVTEGFMMSGMPLIRLPTGDITPISELPLSVEFNDLHFLPDLHTFKVIPWTRGVASVIVDPCIAEGKPVAYASRQVAKTQIERLEQQGLHILSSLEYEFSALDAKLLTPVHKDITGHLTKQFLYDWDYLTDIHENLTHMGLIVEQIDSEGEYGVYEFPVKPSGGLQAGDDGFWLKKTVREISRQRGYMASFSSKPFLQSSGVAGHFNHSLTNLPGDELLFYDPNSANKMSKTMQNWLAGLIRHAPAMLVFGCPTASCQRRFSFHDRATPQYPDWGIDNRTCSFRVKIYSPERTYIENRIFAAGCNPYLALAVNIAAGLDGVMNELPLPPMVRGNAHSSENVVPGTRRFSGKLADAVSALEEDKVLCEALGEDFIRVYLNAKRHECRKEKKAIASGDGTFYDREYLPYL